MAAMDEAIRQAWFGGEKPFGVKFGLNGAVLLVRGPYAGQAGAIISLEAMDPERVYLVELRDTGEGVTLSQADLV